MGTNEVLEMPEPRVLCLNRTTAVVAASERRTSGRLRLGNGHSEVFSSLLMTLTLNRQQQRGVPVRFVSIQYAGTAVMQPNSKTENSLSSVAGCDPTVSRVLKRSYVFPKT